MYNQYDVHVFARAGRERREQGDVEVGIPTYRDVPPPVRRDEHPRREAHHARD